MKKLVFGALIAVAASGCIITSGDSGNDAFITANWTIKSIASGTAAPCPPGFDTAALYSQEVDSTGHNVGAPIIDLFNCDAGTGVSAPLPPADYDAWIEITNTNNTSQYATSTTAAVNLTVADKSFTATLLTDGGYFQFAWNLTRKSDGTPVTCAGVSGIGGVESIATEVSNPNNSANDIFPCTDGIGITGGFLASTYTVSIDAINSSTPPGAISDIINLTNKVVGSPNKVTDLGTITVPITNL